jgi:hypothetical protein
VVRDDNRSQAAAKGKDMKYRAENAAHNARENVVDTAHNIKHKVDEKLDNIKREHQR